MNLLYAVSLFCAIHTVLCDDNSIASLFGTSPRQDLNFVDLANYDGYTAEHHYVTTEDGYILGLFRLPIKASCNASKGVIMFFHGLYLSSDDCLIPGPGKAHCYVYADNCYDIWAPNVRGNFYSRNHTTYNPDSDSEFWDFSVDQMALYDLPAAIDYVLAETNETQLSYVAHSQGVSMLLILCAKKPEYNAKIKVGFGLSPTAWLDHSRFIIIKLQSILAPGLTLTDNLLNVEVLKRNGLVNNAAELLCGTTYLAYPFCSVLIFAVLGYNKFQITDDVLPVVVGHIPSGTSLRNFVRWGQIQNNGFSEYDYGLVKNLITYKKRSPPLYDLSPITMPWVLFASENDYVANVTDVKYLASKLKNVSVCVLSDTTFGHLDFIYGKDIPNYLTPPILSYLETGAYTCP
ncbi:lipase member K-like [Helicoverpa zea]|uniref:lipase member K-like n=1 Tax=Helicoverpa zea TaxID=7113 RepID=UPI001F59363A|nr:lipase member K-like [Helicoverpa zea]